MSSRRMLTTFSLTLLFATILNAPSILHTADIQDSGVLGTTARVLATPLRLLDWIGLDAPRRALDASLGGGTRADDTEPSVTTTVPPSTAPNETTTTTTLPPVANEIWFGGDSIVYDVGNALASIVGTGDDHSADPSTGPPKVVVDSKISSGLARPDKFNWPKRIADQMQARNPAVAVFMVGGNDNQDMRGGGRDWTMADDAVWQTEYARRVGVTMDLLSGPTKRPVIWLGMPNVANPNDRNRFALQNAIYAAEAKKRPNVTYVDLWKTFSDKRGNYADVLAVPGGDAVRMRVSDGMHFTEAGGMRAARAAWPEIEKAYRMAMAADRGGSGTTSLQTATPTSTQPGAMSGATTTAPPTSAPG